MEKEYQCSMRPKTPKARQQTPGHSSRDNRRKHPATVRCPVGETSSQKHDKSANGIFESSETNVGEKRRLNRVLQRAKLGRSRALLGLRCRLNDENILKRIPEAPRENPTNAGRRGNRVGERYRCVSCGHKTHAYKNAPSHSASRGRECSRFI